MSALTCPHCSKHEAYIMALDWERPGRNLCRCSACGWVFIDPPAQPGHDDAKKTEKTGDRG